MSADKEILKLMIEKAESKLEMASIGLKEKWNRLSTGMFIKKLPELIQSILNIDVDNTEWDGIEKLNFK